jgi:hypothetical protein
VRSGARAAHGLRNLLALTAACSTMLAVAAQTSVANPVTGVLGAVRATATQQLDSVAHDATAITPPAPPPAGAQVAANAAQSVAAVPQPVAGAGEVVRSNASSLAESSRAGGPGEGSGSSDAGKSSSPSSLIAAATRAGRVVASPTPARGEHAAIVTGARRIVSSRIDRAASTLAYAEQRTPTARALAGRASHVAGALLGAVANVATSARDTLAAVPVPVPAVASLLRATLPSTLFTLLPTPVGAGAGTSVAQQGANATAFATSLASIGPAQAAPSTADSLGARRVQQLATNREATTNPRATMHAPREATPLTTSATPASVASLAKAPVAASPARSQSVPAPSPGGFSPASSASVGGGVSAATFVALAALLLLAAPRALRRLQRTDTSWRLAQFSLIPARPG